MPYDDTDNIKDNIRSGLVLYTDHLTGCQYIGNLFGGLIPRVDGMGWHLGCNFDEYDLLDEGSISESSI